MTDDEGGRAKGGDRVRIVADKDHPNPTLRLKAGTVLTVAERPRNPLLDWPHLICCHPLGGEFCIRLDAIEAIDGPPGPCTCPTPALMARGCTCGSLDRERRAQTLIGG